MFKNKLSSVLLESWYIAFLILVCFSSQTLASNNITISLTASVEQFSGNTAYISHYYGKNKVLVDSAVISSTGTFWFKILESSPKGVYNIAFLDRRNSFYQFDLIYTQVPVALQVYPDSFPLRLSTTEDDIENTLFNQYIHTYLKFAKKEALLYKLRAEYEPETDFYQTLSARVEKNNKLYNSELMLLTALHPESYTSLLLNWLSTSFGQEILSSPILTDSSIMYSTIIPDKLERYIGTFANSEMAYDEQEAVFFRATDSLFLNLAPHGREALNIEAARVYDFCVDQWMRLVEVSPYNTVYIYTAKKYLFRERCDISKLEELSVKDKITKIRQLAVGKKAPEIIMNQSQGIEMRLSDIKARYTLVLFWASWCPHCTTLLPTIGSLYSELKAKDFAEGNNADKTLEVLSISLDTDRNQWVEHLVQGNHDWLNFSELKGWESEVALDYNVRATPTLFLLDSAKKIIGKPTNINELKLQITQPHTK